MVSSVFGVPVNVWLSSAFGELVNLWISSVAYGFPVFERNVAFRQGFVWRSFWRNFERMVSSVYGVPVFGEPVNVWISSVFGVTCERMDFVSFWRTCERMGFVSSVFGVPVNVRISSFFDVPVILWFRQFLAYL